MEITDEELVAFQEAYAIDYGEEIALDEGRAMLARLVLFYECMGEPLFLRHDGCVERANACLNRSCALAAL